MRASPLHAFAACAAVPQSLQLHFLHAAAHAVVEERVLTSVVGPRSSCDEPCLPARRCPSGKAECCLHPSAPVPRSSSQGATLQEPARGEIAPHPLHPRDRSLESSPGE